jgi:hypothetical protein
MRSHLVGAVVCLIIVMSGAPAARASLGEQGVQLQGVQLQGVQLQGVQLQGVQLQGVQLQGVQLQGVQLQGVQLQNSQLVGYSGTTYKSGAAMEGAYLQTRLSNNQTAWLYVVDVKTSTATNTMSAPAHRSNSDVSLYHIKMYGDAGWFDPCPGDHYGMLLAGVWDSDADWYSSSDITYACSSGVLYKCAHNWGYKPWKGLHDAHGQWHSAPAMAELHETCVHAARAAYCGSIGSFTEDGNAVDLYDNYGFNTPLGEDARHGMFGLEAYFDANGAYEIFDNTRNDHYATEQGFSCITVSQEHQYKTAPAPGTINGRSYANKQQWLTDGGWSSPQTAYQLGLHHIAVASATQCPHAPALLGEPLAVDCNSCTRAVCGANPECCVTDAFEETGYWSSTCVAAAQQLCGAQLWSEPRPFFDDTLESNDTLDGARNLYWGFLNGLWVSGADHDFYRFPFGATSVELTYDQADGDVNARVWQNGVIIATAAGVTGREVLSVPSGAALEVYASGAVANVYHLALNGWDAADELASETCSWEGIASSRGTATAIGAGFHTSLGVCNGGQAWFANRGTTSQRVHVNFDGAAGNLNATAYTSSGAYAGFSIGTGNVETVTVPAGGTLQVWAVSGASNHFSLTVLPTTTPSEDVITLNTMPYKWNTIYPAGDVDEFVAEYRGKAIVSFEHDRGDLGVSVYDRNNQLIGFSFGSGDVETVSVPSGGKIRVYGFSGATNAYSIVLVP